MQNEIWKPVKGYEGLYQVSSLGRLRKVNGVLLKANPKSWYCSVSLMKNNVRKTFKVHRLVALVFVPNPENKPEINHKDGNKQNNHYLNLEWVTRSENQLHAIRELNANTGKGESHGSAKLDKNSVSKIRNSDRPSKELARVYGVDQSTINRVRRGETWK